MAKKTNTRVADKAPEAEVVSTEPVAPPLVAPEAEMVAPEAEVVAPEAEVVAAEPEAPPLVASDPPPPAKEEAHGEALWDQPMSTEEVAQMEAALVPKRASKSESTKKKASRVNKGEVIPMDQIDFEKHFTVTKKGPYKSGRGKRCLVFRKDRHGEINMSIDCKGDGPPPMVDRKYGFSVSEDDPDRVSCRVALPPKYEEAMDKLDTDFREYAIRENLLPGVKTMEQAKMMIRGPTAKGKPRDENDESKGSWPRRITTGLKKTDSGEFLARLVIVDDKGIKKAGEICPENLNGLKVVKAVFGLTVVYFLNGQVGIASKLRAIFVEKVDSANNDELMQSMLDDDSDDE